MSLLGSIGSALKGGVKGFLSGGPTGAVMGGLKGLAKGSTSAPPKSQMMGMAVKPGAGLVGISNPVIGKAIGQVGQTITKYGPTVGRVAAGAATAAYVGGAIYDAAGNYLGQSRKRRRMNPLNARAARRAIRRIKAVRKITMDIERSLPKQRTSRSAPRRGSNPDFIQLRNS